MVSAEIKFMVTAEIEFWFNIIFLCLFLAWNQIYLLIKHLLNLLDVIYSSKKITIWAWMINAPSLT